MRHYIIVRYGPLVTNRLALEEQIRALFAPAAAIDGVWSVTVRPAAIVSANRHDLMVLVEMERGALAAFDASDIHARWKREFSQFIEAKTIFDCE